MAMLSVSHEDYLWFVDEALDGMIAIVTELGDVDVNVRPDLPGANSAYVILTHCLGVMEFWAGPVVAGRPTDRDRDAEFVARGTVDDLHLRVIAARQQLEVDLVSLDTEAPPRASFGPDDAAKPLGRSQGGALIHILEELYQHTGQMELSRDLLLSDRDR